MNIRVQKTTIDSPRGCESLKANIMSKLLNSAHQATVIRGIVLKCSIFMLAALTACSGLLFAQGFSGSSQHPTYDPKMPPPLALPEAYTLVLTRIGAATNRFYCVTASWLEKNNEWSKGWTFGFSNTNGEIAQVKVFFFDKQVFIDAHSAELLK
jgi:hypothetical protein